ncbi:MAG: WYL domain-containing protein [Bacteroidales bacterium]|nr:WYL domain-containing protein [Bacteroidales bacterium]
MSQNLINKYVWLVETLYRAKKITLKEINRRWLETDLSEGLEIPRRTFHSWKNAVEEMFGLVILCDKSDGDRYYIENREVLEDDGLQRWLLNTMSASNTLLDNKSLSDRILLESIPSGQTFLEDVMKAMKQGKVLEITYKSYWREHESTFRVAPYCVKLFRQRWYLVGNSVNEGKIRIYSLDRFLEAKLTDEPFDYPKDFSPEVYFEGCFGIIREENCPLETVKLKVSPNQANYLRSLPLHHTQKELVQTADYSIFSVEVRPTFDFRQELLWNGDAIQVLEPLWLRQEMAKTVQRMRDNYKTENK